MRAGFPPYPPFNGLPATVCDAVDQRPSPPSASLAVAIEGGGAGGGQWDPLLTPIEAARLLRTSVKTLERWRSQGHGPAYAKPHGFKVFYPRSALRTFVEGCTVTPPRVECGEQNSSDCSHLAHTIDATDTTASPPKMESESKSRS
jgi:hypothetical protein